MPECRGLAKQSYAFLSKIGSFYQSIRNDGKQVFVGSSLNGPSFVLLKYVFAMMKKGFLVSFKELIPILSIFLMVSGCNTDKDNRGSAPNMVLIDLDKGDEGLLLDYYFGAYTDGAPRMVLHEEDSKYFLQPATTLIDFPNIVALHNGAGEDGVITWEEFEAWILDSYYNVIDAPASLDRFRDVAGDWNQSDWFSHEVKGQMTRFRRRLSIPRSAIYAALEEMDRPQDAILYPVGTSIVGEHLQNDTVVETTVMMKRKDGYWDYFAYNEEGLLATTVQKDPNPMSVPTKCLGCHFGDRQFEPEKSFPSVARPGPNGERHVFVPDQFRDKAVRDAFSEHARRSDTILGLYVTLFISDMLNQAEAGLGKESDQQILTRLGFD